MADILDVDVNYPGKLANSIIIKPVFQADALEKYFDVRLGIKTKEQLALNTSLQRILRPSVGCGRDQQGNVINVYEKFIEVCDLKANLEQCAKNIASSFFTQMLKTGNEEYDLTGTDVEDFIVGRVVDALKLDVVEIAWFGDTDSEDEYLSSCDGIWKRVFTAIDEYGIDIAYDIQVNEDGSLPDCEGLNTLRALYSGASDLLDEQPEETKYMLLTRELYDNYVNCREDACCGDRSWEMIEEGKRQMFYKGIKVDKMSNWSRAIKDFGLDYKHRAMYYQKGELVVGTDAISDTNSFDFWYDKKDKMNYIDVEMKMGTQIIYDEMVIVALGD